MRTVATVLQRVGYRVETIENRTRRPWHLLYSFYFPYAANLSERRPQVQRLYNEVRLADSGKVNAFYGSMRFASKVHLAMNPALRGVVPESFRIPQDLNAFRRFVHERPEERFLLKKNTHRGVRLLGGREAVEALAESGGGAEAFVQRFIPNPLLIDGRKFDIGVRILFGEFIFKRANE